MNHLLLLMFTSTLFGSVPQQPLRASVCEVKKSPASFDGKLVRIRAKVSSGFEVFGIGDPTEDCGLIWLSIPGTGPDATTSVLANTPKTRPALKIKTDRQFKRFEELVTAEMHPRSRGKSCIACKRYEVTATLTGRVDHAPAGQGF